MSVISQRSVETMAHTDKAHSAPTKINPSMSDFCHPDVPNTWPQLLLKQGI